MATGSERPGGEGVAVCMVTHDDAGDLPECLEAVGRLRHRPLELVVVDCDSSDGSLETARRVAPPGIRATVEAAGANLGFAGGMNRALAATRAPLVLSLNADTRVSPDYLERLLDALEAAPGLRVGAVTGRLLRFPGDGPQRLDACGMRLTPTWRHLDRGSGTPDRGQLGRLERVFGATGAASLFLREALEDVAVEGQVFAAEFHSFREDAELCFRLRERSWEVLYQPQARCLHRRSNLPRRRRRMQPAVNYHSLKNRYLLRAYHQTWSNALWTFLPALWRDLLALGYVLLREPSSLAAYAWLWRHREEIRRRRRLIQGRRTVPSREIDRWFLRNGVPL